MPFWQIDMTEEYMKRMKNLVEISKLVTQSQDFFKIKDIIVSKMLDVVHPAKACVNIFYNDDFNYAYLVCSSTLKYIPTVFDGVDRPEGARIDFDLYPDYIREAVEEKKIVYIKDIFLDESAAKERNLAENEGYCGRAVFPFVIEGKVVGFMTTFTTEGEIISDEDMNFIASVASLMTLSIEITRKNESVHKLVNKLRQGMTSINEATRKLYEDKNIDTYLKDLTKQAVEITDSEEAIIILDKNEKHGRIVNCYNKNECRSNLFLMLDEISENYKDGDFANDVDMILENGSKINSYIYHRLMDEDSNLGYIICANATKYTKDDINILSILSKQITVGTQLYEYNQNEVRHRVLQNELSVLNKQQRLIMNDANMICNGNRQLYCYHQPAKVVGGDFYDAVRISDDKVIYIVADVMGHGIVSNYMVALIKGAFKVLCRQFDKPSDIMNNLNKMLFEEFDKMEVFCTGIVASIDTKENTLTVSNAGHYSPVIIQNDGTVAKYVNCKKGIPIGVIEEREYKDNQISMENYPMICMFTDGILEIKNKDKEEFGQERFEKLLCENYKYSPEFIIEKAKEVFYAFSGKKEYSDDIMMVMLKDNYI